MGKIDYFEYERLGVFKWAGPGYYDHPDGEDLSGKLKFASIISTAAGLTLGGIISSGGIKPPPKNLAERLIRTVRCIVPCFGVAMTFTLVTYYSTRLRGKDDEINYLIGGLISGASLAALTPYRDFGVYGAIVFSLMGGFKKHRQLQGKEMIDAIPHSNFPNYYARNFDSSLTTERPGNWTKQSKV